jgi:DNA helicase-4
MEIIDALLDIFSSKQKREAEQVRFLADNSDMIEDFIININNLGKSFIKSSELKLVKEKYNGIYELGKQKKYKKINDKNFVYFMSIYSNIDNFINEKNEDYIKNEILENKDLLDNIDGKSLDSQQRNAVVINNDANLIISGAGSGKTLTIAAKVKYLGAAEKVENY